MSFRGEALTLDLLMEPMVSSYSSFAALLHPPRSCPSAGQAQVFCYWPLFDAEQQEQPGDEQQQGLQQQEEVSVRSLGCVDSPLTPFTRRAKVIQSLSKKTKKIAALSTATRPTVALLALHRCSPVCHDWAAGLAFLFPFLPPPKPIAAPRAPQSSATIHRALFLGI